MTFDPASLIVTAALTAASMGLQATRRIEGPRLKDLKVTVADYGTALNYFKGIRRFEGCPIIWAEEIREVKRRRKTKGGKFNDYTYYGTWAVAIADHLIDGVTRIWFDKHLVYDLTGAGPVTPFQFADRFTLSDYVRVYNGTEDQEPDPRMLATVEEKEGVGSCPAYRGVAYVVFEEVPLEKVGNRIPQITIEAVAGAGPVYPFETYEPKPPGMNRLWSFTYSPDFSRFFVGSLGGYEIWDVAARTRMIAGTAPVSVSGTPNRVGVQNNGDIWTVGDGGLVRFSADGLSVRGIVAIPPEANTQSEVWIREDGDGNEWLFTVPFSFVSQFVIYDLTRGISPGYVDTNALGYGFTPSGFVTDAYGDIWCYGRRIGPFQNPNVVLFYRAVKTSNRSNPDFAFVSVQQVSGGIANLSCCHGPSGFVLSWAGNKLYLVDDQTFAVTATRDLVVDVFDAPKQFANCPPGASSIWLGYTEVSLTDLTTIRTVDPLLWKAEDSDGIIYDPVNNALISAPQFANAITWRFLDRLGTDGVTLRTIVEDVAERCGLEPGAIDATALTQIVKGYSWTRGTGKEILEPLLDIYDSICRPHDFVIEFRQLGSASAGTIDVAHFVRQGDNRYIVQRVQDTDLPRRLTVSFADPDADQQANAVVVQRPLDSVDGVRETVIDLTPWAASVDDARQFAERYFRRQWFGRMLVENAVTAQFLAIEPGDVRTLTLDSGVSFLGRCTRQTIGANGVISCTWERDDSSVAVLSGATGAPMDGRDESTILVPLIAKGFVLDIPLLRDADSSSNPLLYYSAGPYATGTWPGAIVYRSLDAGELYEEEWATVPSQNAAAWGYATTTLGDANPRVWDRGNSVTIKLQNGILTGTTEEICNANTLRNLALLGQELIQFTTATLNVDGTWTLSGLKRGRRGTEWACPAHATGEEFLLLDVAGSVQMGASDLGTDLYFKAGTIGRELGAAFPVVVEGYSGASLKPYAPAHLAAEIDGSGDWSIEWIRRTRIGGAWTGGTTIPIGETSEAYEVDILDGSTVKRTLSVTSPEAVYTAAQQTTDFGAPQSSISIRVYQLGADVGRGFPAVGTF